jgi:hypothetical protein
MLVVFAHPRCPCSAATFDQLAEVAANAGEATKISVVFFTPADAGAEWTQSPTVLQAAGIPGVTIVADERGREAGLFHAFTSGRTLLYDREGALVFDGGITGSRGHAGENAGATALLEILTKGGNVSTRTPVFGCPIRARTTTPESISCAR